MAMFALSKRDLARFDPALAIGVQSVANKVRRTE
jgi:hypothetical protein